MTFRGRILAIDDEVNIRRFLTEELEQEGFKVETAESGEQGLALLDRESYDLALVDLKLPGMSGIDVIKNMRRMPSPPETIVITGYGDIDVAVQSMKLGARDFVTKPFKLSELIPLIDQGVREKRVIDNEASPSLSPVKRETQTIVCRSAAMQDIYRQIRRVAPTDATVLIQGETGVGKDVIAREIHVQSRRKENPYVVVDCGLLNGNLAESELYGHRKGAFSGAYENKVGLVAASDGGTLFLDEIGNIDLEIQKKLLRFLETKRYRRVGDVSETSADTRIILATNMLLTDAARTGAFRSDLLYRLDVVCIRIPPLRERPEDVPLLAEHFVKSHSEVTSTPIRISSRAMDLLTQYPWPGNVRELRSVIFKTIVLASSSVIKPEDLPCLIASKDPRTEQFVRSLGDVEKDHIVRVLQEVGGNQSKAAKILGINRRTLYNKMHRHNIVS
ncbi:MAG: sigma-54 dependent transcriptional regulator [Thermodesulfobacteriota bacterium]